MELYIMLAICVNQYWNHIQISNRVTHVVHWWTDQTRSFQFNYEYIITWSLMKWWFISICLVLEWCIGFFVKFIALVLSHNNGIWDNLRPKSLSCCLIHKLYVQQLPIVMYSASVVDRATQDCFLLCHEIKLDPSRWHVPLVLFLSILHPTKLLLE